MSRPNLRTIAVTLVAFALPATLVVGAITAMYLKSNNPDNVDISQGLAYLQQVFIVSAVTFTVFVVAIVACIVAMYRSDKNFSNAKLPLTLLVGVVVLLGGFGFVNSYTNHVQDQYLIDHGRPTVDQYFEQMKKQQNQ